VAKYKKSLTNPYLYRQFSNNASEMFDYTMTNVMDGFYDGAMNSAIDGTFKAVCLSGIKSEDTKGGSEDGNDAVVSGKFINLIVRPLTDFGNIMPDPRKSKDPDEINGIISLHSSTFLARSDDTFDVTRGIDFGEVIDCYFEEGSISNSDFRTLRFSQPKGKVIETSYQALATISGVTVIGDADWSSAGLLGDSSPYEGNLVTVSGNKRYLGSISSGISPPNFWKSFRKKIEAHIKSEYPELGFKVANLGVTRDLAASADRGGNTARASGSKHGAGLAQDLYLHTEKYGKYTSYKKFNPILAQDQKLVDSIIRFMRKPEYSRIMWGGSFGSGKQTLNIGDIPKGRGLLEFHHFEFKNNEIPNLFKGYEVELASLGMKPSELVSTSALAKLYKKLL
jgi:hypothetical protein